MSGYMLFMGLALVVATLSLLIALVERLGIQKRLADVIDENNDLLSPLAERPVTRLQRDAWDIDRQAFVAMAEHAESTGRR